MLTLSSALGGPPGAGGLYLDLMAVFWLCLLALVPSQAGFREMLPNRVVTFGGATWISPKPFPIELLLIAAAGTAVLTGGVLQIHIFGSPATFLVGSAWEIFVAATTWVTLGPAAILFGSWLLLVGALWSLLRGIRMTPESITYWRGGGTITLGWDDLGDAVSVNDVRDHTRRTFRFRRWWEPEYDWYLPGAKIVIPADRATATRVPVHWQDENTPRLLLETDHMIVEPSALLSGVLALRDHPELRPLLGTRAARTLFVGPPWRVRRHMYRTQQWWPKGAAPAGIAVDRDGVVTESW